MTVLSPARFVPCSGETWRDPFGMYAALRDEDPVHHVEDGDYWVLSRYADVEAAAVDAATFSSAQGLTFTYDDRLAAGLDEVTPLVMLDPPEHTALRRVVSRAFTPRHVQAIEPAVRAFVVERVERLRDLGQADVVAELLGPLPSFVVGQYLGVPAEDRERFDAWTDGIVAATAQGDPLQAGDTVLELFGYFSELAERLRREPGDDVLSGLVAGADGEPSLTPLQVLGFAFTMITGGNDTTTGLLGGALERLTDRPDQRELLLADPGLVPDAVEELLRLTSPVQGLARTTTRDVAVDGVEVPAGRRVMLLYAAGNRDAREFGPHAEELDVERRPGRVLTFSLGGHHCLGAAAARLMARVALEELLARCPRFGVDAGAGRFAPGHFVRRYASLPFTAG